MTLGFRWKSAAPVAVRCMGALLLSAVVSSVNAQGSTPAGGTAPAAEVRSVRALAPGEYRLGAGDVVRIVVFQNPDLALETRLTDGGMINYPLLGPIKLGGLSVTESAALIADSLRKGEFVKNPQVTVTLTLVRGSQVSVLGQVARPGRYPLEQGDTRLIDMLAQAGGALVSSGSDTLVVVGTRSGEPYRREIDMPRLFESAGAADNLLLQNGDVLWVDRQPFIYIFGEALRPGQFRLERDMSVRQAIAAGGGITQRGTLRGLTIYRRGADGKSVAVAPGLDDPLEKGDVIQIPASLF